MEIKGQVYFSSRPHRRGRIYHTLPQNWLYRCVQVGAHGSATVRHYVIYDRESQLYEVWDSANSPRDLGPSLIEEYTDLGQALEHLTGNGA